MLTQLAVSAAKPRDTSYKLSDGGGLALLVKPGGTKLWRFRYHFAGKERMLSLGAYPAVSIAAARKKRDEAREVLGQGQDPAQKRRNDKVAAALSANNTFAVVAAEYIDRLEKEGAAASTVSKNKWLLQDLATPLAKRPVADITPAEILDLCKRIEKSGRRDTARRLRGTIGSVFRYAVVTLRAQSDPTYALKGALLKPEVNHRAAIVDEPKLGALMISIDQYDGWPTLRAALLLLALTMTRPGDVRHMRKSENISEGALADTGRTHENAPASRCPALQASARGDPRHVGPDAGKRTIAPFDTLEHQAAFGKCHELRFAAHGIFEGGSDGARLPLKRQHHPQRAGI